MNACGGLAGLMAAGKVGIGIQVRLNVFDPIAYPSDKAIARTSFQVADESVQLAVTRGSPLRDTRSKLADGVLQVKARNPSCVENFHENTNSAVSKIPFSRSLSGRTLEQGFANPSGDTVRATSAA